LTGIILIIFAYLLGSIPTGVVASKMLGTEDPREKGSGNIGATNVTRIAGKKAGVITIVGDVGKGLIPALLAIYIVKSPVWVSLVALSAFTGHIYSLFLGFEGGKGVATAAGVFLAISPLSLLLSIFVFGMAIYKWKYVSLSSLSAAASLPLFLWFFTDSNIYIILGLIVSCLIFYKHKENIVRLREGVERKMI
jgi:glycerol-3-phosphate acyltransferase PlsY